MVERRSSSAAFVVRGITARLTRRLQQRADLDIIGEVDDGLVIRIDAKKPTALRALWETVKDELTAKQLAAPVLVDSSGDESFPTGRVQVRFSAEPTPKELRDFTRKYSIKLVEQNKLQAKQASFVANAPRDTFLPDLVASLSKESSVATAWQEAQASYRRTLRNA